ncbi:hypothetical protein [Xylophilus rhododendri]|uniref:hypothetical protein n=1 Tax=Xylophilus rhododendri TaxID=2697032 RepID=UPI0018A2EF7C|nr:hypothetical protein [Xylophilus rhododendri]
MNERKATITPEHRQEAAALKAIYDQVRPANQGEFGKAHDIGGQTMVANYLNAHSPLNLKAATGFALGLGCKIRDFSKRLAAEAHKAAEAAGVVGADEDFVAVPRLTVSAGAGPGRIPGVVEEDGALQFRFEFLRAVSLPPKMLPLSMSVAQAWSRQSKTGPCCSSTKRTKPHATVTFMRL